MLADAGVPQNSEFPAFVNSYVSVRNRVAELERAQTVSEHGSDHGKGFQRFLDERDWGLQSARARVQELESMIKRQGSRTSFGSVVSMDPQTPPGLLAATVHSRPMSVADPLHEWYEASVHNPHESAHVHARVSHAPTPPPPAPPPGGDDDSSSSSESDVEARRRKKKRGLYTRSRTRRCACLNILTHSRSNRGGVLSGCPPFLHEKPERARAFVFSVESDDASFDSLAVSDSDKHRALDAKLAETFLKIVKGDLKLGPASRGHELDFGEAWSCASWTSDSLPDLS